MIQHVREQCICRDCEAISEPQASICDATRLGRAQPAGDDHVRKIRPASAAECQAERYAREGVPLSLSTLADQVGACTAALMPLFERLRSHVMAADRVNGDDTTVPVLARGKTDIARAWVYVRR